MSAHGWLALLACPALLAGCGPATSTVRGDVTVDGQPLDRGVITFAPLDAAGEPATAAVVGGRYEVRTTPGKKRVQVSAPVVTGKRKSYNAPDAPVVEITQERLPPRYHSNSELTYDAPSGSSTKDWALETKGRK